jgi:general secretion pathway protein J
VFTMWRELFRIRTEAVSKPSEKTPTILIDGVQSLRFRYFGSMDPEKEPAWADNWPKGESLPRLISVEVGFPPGDARRWPPLIIPVQASR